jgi:hypothetical protein
VLKDQGESGRVARLKMADRLIAANLAAKGPVLAQVFKDHDDVRAAVAGKVRGAMAASPAPQDSWMLGQVVGVADALEALGDARAFDTALAWLDGSPAAKAGDVPALAEVLAKRKDAGKVERAAIVEYVTCKHLGDTAPAKPMGIAEWKALIAVLHKDLPAEVKSVWSSRLWEANTAGAALASLTWDDAGALADVLAMLGASRRPALMAAWAKQPGKLQTLEVSDLVVLARDLLRSDEGAAVGPSLADHVDTTYIQNAAALGALKPEDVLRLRGILSDLKDKRAGNLLGTWVLHTTTWQQLDLTALASLAESLRGAKDVGRPGLEMLAGYVTGTHAANAATARAGPPKAWAEMADATEGVLSKETQALWANALWQGFVEHAPTLAALKTPEAKRLKDALGRLDRKRAAGAAYLWFSAQESLAKEPVSELLSILIAALDADQAREVDKEALVRRVEPAFAAARAGKPRPGAWEHRMMAQLFARVGNAEKARQYALQGYQDLLGTPEAAAKVAAPDLQHIGCMLMVGGLTGEGTGYEEFARALVRVAKGQEFICRYYDEFPRCAAPLGTDATRAIVEAAVTDEAGNVHQHLSMILAWAYQRAGKIEAWKALLDGKIAAPGLAGDAKARWLASRAYTEGVAKGGRFPPLMYWGREFKKQAIQAAQSESLKLTLLREFAMEHADAEVHDEGLAYLETMAGQVPPEALDSLRHDLQERKAAWIQKELGYARGSAERMEAKASEAGLAGDEKLKKAYIYWAERSRDRERELLEMPR